MSEIQALIDECVQTLASIEENIQKHEHVVVPDETQLRIAAHRLGMFAEQHASQIEDRLRHVKTEEAVEEEAAETKDPAPVKPTGAKTGRRRVKIEE